MIRFAYIFLIVIFSYTTSIGQDTIRYGNKIDYTGSTSIPFKTAREDIVYSETHKQIEYCYYFGTQRHCSDYDYEIKNDSIITVDKIVWKFKKINDHYYIERSSESICEFGFVKSLIPFEYIGKMITTTSDKQDTLWITDYLKYNPTEVGNKPAWEFKKSKTNGRVYSNDEIDQKPTLLNGDTIKTIHLTNKYMCLNEPYYYILEVQFVVTAEGRIQNIESSIGNFDLDFCPYTYMGLVEQILNLGKLKPAMKNGKNVNVLWKVKIEESE